LVFTATTAFADDVSGLIPAGFPGESSTFKLAVKKAVGTSNQLSKTQQQHTIPVQ
jgi:hypothetical protein